MIQLSKSFKYFAMILLLAGVTSVAAQDDKKSKSENTAAKKQQSETQKPKTETQTPSQDENLPTLKEAKKAYREAIEQWRISFKDVHKALREFHSCEREEADKWREAWHKAVNEGNRRRDIVGEKALMLARVGRGTTDGVEAQVISGKMISYDAKEGRYGRANKMCEEFLDIDPKNYTVIAQLAIICMKTNRFKRAQELIDQLHAQKITAFDGKFRQLKQLTSAWKKELEIREAEKDDNLPVVRLTTSQGSMDFQLFENQAPNTVANFIHLIKIGFYNGKTFHRAVAGFMAQGGCPNGNGTGDAGYMIKDEHHRDDFRKHFRGVLSMAKTTQPNSGGSQFFITFSPQPRLDGKHTVFGRIIKGEEVLDRLKLTHKLVTNKGETKEKPIEGVKPDKIIKAEILSAPDKEYVPEKIKR